jgi:pimeloyl-ACP methyl ester carboxylesterase
MFRINRCLYFFTLVLITSFTLFGCGGKRHPDLARLFNSTRSQEGKRPVIIIPGVLGSQLVNKKTGEVVWPSIFRSSNDELGLPVATNISESKDNLEAVCILERAKFTRVIPDVEVYYNLIEALNKYAGYKRGDWDKPSQDGDKDTFYIFSYDWRRDNVESSRELIRRVEALKRNLNKPDLKFNIVAHSMGGLIARYAAMYGEADLPDGTNPPQPTWAGASFINKLFMFGTPNEGSAEALTTLIEGYSITEGLRRRIKLLNKLSRTDLLTIPSVYQLLPSGEASKFLDENLNPIQLDIYDPAIWKYYGWGIINDDKFREQFKRDRSNGKSHDNLNCSIDELDEYFALLLNRAKRFHQALKVVSANEPVPMFVLGGDCEETLAAPLILPKKKKQGWLTLTTPRKFRNSSGRLITRKEALQAMYEPGDGRVTKRSLLGERLNDSNPHSLYNTYLPIKYAAFACDLHSDIQNNSTLQDNALTILISEAFK